MQGPAVEIRGLTKEYVVWKGFWGFLRPEHKQVLRGIDLEARAGEVLGIAGPNAAGKTTLLKIVAGLLGPTTGQVLVHGEELFAPRSSARRKVAIALAESRSFYWRLTVRHNLIFFASLWGIDSRDAAVRIEEMAAVWRLEDRLDDRFHELSSGLMQRVALARMMISGAKVWLLDEPTRDLDEASEKQLFQAMRELAAQGGTVLLVSHDQEHLDDRCDRCVRLQDGLFLPGGAGS